MREDLIHFRGEAPQKVSAGRVPMHWGCTGLVFAACLLVFGGLHNPYWSRGGDSDVYLAIARNLFHGKGLTFNNNPVAVVPPLWPWVLAAALKVSSSFAFLKLLPLLSMSFAIVLWHRIVLRYIEPKWSVVVVLLCAGLSQVFMLALWFHTEAFYCLISSLAVLLALQINEGQSFWWRAGVILALLVAGCLTRWAGIMWWAVAAAALLRGELPGMNRRTALVAVSLIVVIATFLVLRHQLRVDHSQLNPMYDTSLAGAYDIGEIATEAPWTDYLNRVVVAGNWFGGLLWQGARDFKPLRTGTLLAGWLVLILMAIRASLDLRRKDWLLFAVLLQAGLLVATWPAAVARYLVPMTPVILLAVIRMGIPHHANWPKFQWPLIQRWALRTFIASIILCNLFIYAIEFHVAHRPDYYASYQAGLNDSLINIARYIDDHDIPENRIAINRADARGNRARISNGWLRAFVVLTDRAIRNLPAEMEGDKDDPNRYPPDDPKVLQWLEQEGITHYLYRGASNTMWHFRRSDSSDAGEWQLYEIRGGRAVLIHPPEVDGWPRNLPET